MPLDKAARSAFRALEKELKSTFREKTKNDSLLIWNGRKVISVRKWKRLAESAGNYEILRYLPNSLTDFYSNFKSTSDQRIISEREKWITDYESALIDKRDPVYGSKICKSCLLHPIFDAGSKGILSIISKGLGLPTTPCNVINYFECPSAKLADDPKIFEYGKYGKIIYKILQFAHQKSKDDNQKTFEIDYDNDVIFRYGHRYGYFRESKIAEEIREIKLHRSSYVSILGVKDLHRCLTDEKSLYILFKQYDTAKKLDYAYGITTENEMSIDDELRDKTIRFFFWIRNKISLEDFKDLAGDIFDEKQENRDSIIRQSQRERFPQEVQRCEQVEKSGQCVDCKQFANIRCINCNVWNCFEHWETHAKLQHKMQFDIQDNLSQRKF